MLAYTTFRDTTSLGLINVQTSIFAAVRRSVRSRLRACSRWSQPVARVFALVAAVRRSIRSRLRALALFALVAPVRGRSRAFATALAPPAAVRAVRARSHPFAAAPVRYLTPAFFLARSIAAICSSESLMEP